MIINDNIKKKKEYFCITFTLRAKAYSGISSVHSHHIIESFLLNISPHYICTVIKKTKRQSKSIYRQREIIEFNFNEEA